MSGDPTPNMFADAESVESLIRQLIGAGSTCWSNLMGAGEFLSDQALTFSEHGHARLREIITGDAS